MRNLLNGGIMCLASAVSSAPPTDNSLALSVSLQAARRKGQRYSHTQNSRALATRFSDQFQENAEAKMPIAYPEELRDRGALRMAHREMAETLYRSWHFVLQ